MRTRLAYLAALVIVATDGLAGARPATLCISAGGTPARCREAARLDVEPSDAERQFTLTDAEERLIEIGVVPPLENTIPRGAAVRVVTLSITHAEADRWPDAVTVTVIDGSGRTWDLALTGDRAVKPWRLALQPGKYELIVRAGHHRPIREEILVGRENVLFSKVLQRNPVVSGEVRDDAGLPLAGALIRAGELSALSDALGRFALEVPSRWPEHLEISYGGLATRTVGVPRAQRSVAIPAVVLTAGGALTVRIDRPDSAASELFVDLMSAANTDRVIRSAAVPAEEPVVRLEGLEPGDYQVMLRGREPLERLTRTVRIKSAGETEVELDVSPLSVVIEVVRNGSGVPAALIEAINHADGWSAALTADGDGRAATTVWQQGDYLFAVRASAEAAPFGTLARVAGDTESVVRLELPDRAIAGRVIDAATGAPIAGAAVRIESAAADGTNASLEITSGAGGRFEFDSLSAGTHILTATADSYLESAPVTVSMGKHDRRADIELKITRGGMRLIRMVNPAGMALREASVLHAVDGVLQRIVSSTGLGEVRLPVASGSTQNVLYVVPREGSLGVFRLRRDGDADTLTVPNAVASLDLQARDTAGKPIPNIRFLMRVDGEIIPPDIQRQLERLRGDPLFTDASGTMTLADLPAAFFELWPLRTYGELQDTLAAVSDSAPVQVALKPGRNSATLTFDRRK